MRTFFLTLLLMCAVNMTFAQQNIHYVYDASGNRTSRSVYIPSRETDESDEEQRNTDNRMTSDWKLIAAPNPTHGHMTIMTIMIPIKWIY
jgi:hypothetical protein